MRRVLVVSDSHGFEGNLKKVVEKVGNIDAFIHLGDFESGRKRILDMFDCDVYMVPGNNDYASDLEKDKIVEIENYRFFLTHGHKYGVYYGTQGLLDKAIENNCNIVLFGHTHIPVVKYLSDITFANPGSISLPRQNLHAFKRMEQRTYVN